MNLEEITVEKVKEAYARTGIEPILFTFKIWQPETGKITCACPLTILKLTSGSDDSWLEDQEIAFIHGIDETSSYHGPHQDWYQRGKEIAAAIFGDKIVSVG